MITLEAMSKLGTFFGAAVFVLLTGCGAGESRDVAGETVPVPEIELPSGPIKAQEGSALLFRPIIANQDQIPGSLRFQSTGGELPSGCQLDAASGELQWTPDEIQGPGQYGLQFSCSSESDPTQVSEYSLILDVAETNVPPQLNAPLEATLAAGSTLEQSIALSDADFPANQISLELKSGPKGVVVDGIRKLLYWEIPADWQEPHVEITLTARDNGTPPLTTSHTLAVIVTEIVAPPAPDAGSDGSNDRIPEVAVDLPTLPRPGEPVESTTLEVDFDPPLVAGDVRLSLMLPHDLRPLLKMRYLDDQDGRLAMMLTNPFEADEVEGNLSDGNVATCELIDSRLVWTWAMTKDLTARGYQNNLRNGVLVVESKSGATPRLVALQNVVEVPAPTLESMLNNDKLQATLIRHERIKKSIPLVGQECSAVVGKWSTNLESQVEGFSLQLYSPKLTQRVNTGTRVSAMQFTEFGFRVLPEAREVSISLDAKPSPTDLFQSRDAARNSLKKRRDSYRKWSGKLNAGQSNLRAANRINARNEFERTNKQTKINQANVLIKNAEEQLARLSVEIPADENLVAKMEKECDAVVAQLEPLRTCVVTGELSRRIDDVRVPVIRLVPVPLDPPGSLDAVAAPE